MRLDRTSHSFRKGYQDAFNNQPRRYLNDGTFQGYDYTEGYDAGVWSQYWDAQRENDRRTK